MRVLFVNSRQGWSSRWGGDSTQLVETKRALEDLGVKVTIADRRLTQRDLRDFDLVHVFNIQTASQAIEDFLAAIHSSKPVVLSTIFWDLRYSRLGLLKTAPASRRGFASIGPNVRWYAHHSARAVRAYLRQVLEYRPAKRMLSLASAILPNSIAELEALVWTFRDPTLRGKSFIVPNGVKPPSLSPADDNGGPALPEKYVLEVGRIEPVKGQLALINALMDAPEIPLVFVGRGQESLYGRECLRLGAQRGNTFFLGELPPERLPAVYGQAKVHALPSLRESPGLATLEAAVYGANCVVSIHGPVVEYFGQAVWYCDPLDLRSIGQAVLGAWNSPLASDLGQRILREFTWEKAGEATLHAYRWVLDR